MPTQDGKLSFYQMSQGISITATELTSSAAMARIFRSGVIMDDE